jgi:hypothetical protein
MDFILDNMENKRVSNNSFLKLREELIALKEEIRSDVVGPVVASFGFIIALVWRDAIKDALDEYLKRAGLLDNAYIYSFVSAIIVTIIVIFIMVIVIKIGRGKKEKIIQKKVEKSISKTDEDN